MQSLLSQWRAHENREPICLYGAGGGALAQGRRRRGRRLLAAAVTTAVLALAAAPAYANGTWQTLPSLPTASYGLAGATAPCPGGWNRTCVYAMGGLTAAGTALSTVQAYNPAASTWATLPSLATGGGLLAGATAPCPREAGGPKWTCVYAIGGYTGAVYLSTVEAYNPATSTWATLPSLPTATGALAGAAAPCPKGAGGLTGTCVYAIGGETASGYVSTVQAYSPVTDDWVTLPSLPSAEFALAGATAPCPRGVSGLAGTCVYAFGGLTAVGAALSTVQAYSPATNTWATLPSLPTASYALAGTTAPCLRGVSGLVGTCVYAFGGYSGTGFLSTVQAYSPATNTWATLPSMPTAGYALAGTAAPCPGGRSRPCVYAYGGIGTSGLLSSVAALDVGQ
jgi:hypothetical protein